MYTHTLTHDTLTQTNTHSNTHRYAHMHTQTQLTTCAYTSDIYKKEGKQTDDADRTRVSRTQAHTYLQS